MDLCNTLDFTTASKGSRESLASHLRRPEPTSSTHSAFFPTSLSHSRSTRMPLHFSNTTRATCALRNRTAQGNQGTSTSPLHGQGRWNSLSPLLPQTQHGLIRFNTTMNNTSPALELALSLDRAPQPSTKPLMEASAMTLISRFTPLHTLLSLAVALTLC